MARSKVRRTFTIDGDVSRLLDMTAEAHDASASKLATRLIREGLERRHRETVDAMKAAGAGVVSLATIATLMGLLGGA